MVELLEPQQTGFHALKQIAQAWQYRTAQGYQRLVRRRQHLFFNRMHERKQLRALPITHIRERCSQRWNTERGIDVQHGRIATLQAQQQARRMIGHDQPGRDGINQIAPPARHAAQTIGAEPALAGQNTCVIDRFGNVARPGGPHRRLHQSHAQAPERDFSIGQILAGRPQLESLCLQALGQNHELGHMTEPAAQFPGQQDARLSPHQRVRGRLTTRLASAYSTSAEALSAIRACSRLAGLANSAR